MAKLLKLLHGFNPFGVLNAETLGKVRYGPYNGQLSLARRRSRTKLLSILSLTNGKLRR
jgi:hypothetical protein